VNAVK